MCRLIGNCREGEDSLVEAFTIGRDIRCLDIDSEKDRSVQQALTERVLNGAQELIAELQADPTDYPGKIKLLEELVASAKAHLTDLGSPPQ